MKGYSSSRTVSSTNGEYFNPSSLSKIGFYIHGNIDTPWNYPGDTILIIDHISKSHHTTNGVNYLSLRRWICICLKGRLHIFATHISTYRRCFNNIDLALTWNQNIGYFNDKGIESPNPRDIFDNNLIDLLRIMLRKGDNVILGINMNKEVRSRTLTK